jgi:glycopeptide antibiotics resistance protein
VIPTAAVVLAVIPAAALVFVRAALVRESPGRTTILLIAVAHVCFVIALTLFPLPVTSEAIAAHRADTVSDHNLIPFASFVGGAADGLRASEVRQIIGNVLLLVPMAIYAPVLWWRAATWTGFVALAIAATVAIELTQLTIATILGYAYRVANVDDVILNSVGAIVAFAIVRFVTQFET